jgi:GNAT superfamily N-acetyltransferase
MTVEIELVETKKQLKQFIKVAWDVYKDDPNWVPWLWYERLQFFDKSHNPFFEHAEADYYIARRDGKAVGSISAILNHRHNEVHEENIAHFGIFEVFDDPEAAAALLEAACQWAKDHGTDKILGPANFSSTMEWGTLIEGFDSPPVILMTYNPPYYIDFIEAAGFTKAMDLYAWNADLFERMKPGGLPEKLIRVVNKVPQRYGLNIRTVDMKNWDAEVAIIKKIYNKAWEKNWGFVPLTTAEFDAIESELKPIIDPNIVFVVEKDGEPVGFCLSLPDANQIIHKLRPGTSVIGSYIAAGRMLLKKKQITRLRVFAFGVLEEFRGKGVDAMMYYETFKAARAQGYQWGEASWILENNEKMNAPIRAMDAELYKRYRVYEKALN